MASTSLARASLWTLLFFATAVQAAAPEALGGETYVIEDTVLMSEPNRFGEGRAKLRMGLKVQIIEGSSSAPWLRIRTPGGREGWIPYKMSALSGRRVQPLTMRKREGGGRSPASVSQSDGFAEHIPDKQLGLNLEYSNQLSRETTSGFGAQFSMAFLVDENWSLGGGFDWTRYSKSASDANYQVSRTTHRLFPHVLGRYSLNNFQFDIGLGIALDRSSIETTDVSSGDVISEDGDGNLVSGSGNETSIGLKISPRYLWRVGKDFSVGAYLSYAMDYALSTASEEDGQGFAGDSDSATLHLFSGGLALALDL